MDLTALQGRRVAVGVGGGIAAYKACELVRELQRAGAQVRVAMTEAAQQFVTPLTFQALSGHAVLTNYFDPAQEEGFGHLDFARWAELYVVAPATADLLARMRAGMGGDAVTTSLLAFRGPVLLAPAMNVAMWENRLTQENLAALLSERRFGVVGPGAGSLACGDVGAGRLADVLEIAAAAARRLSDGPLAGKRVLVTAGPTREYLDPVRFLSNPSTGKMGLALAEAARALGAKVTVVLGPVGAVDRTGLEVVDVVSAEDMAREVLARVESADVFIASAAVSDWRPAQVAPQKVKKTERPEVLELVRTPDVLAEASRRVAGRERRPLLVGFAAETERVLEHAREKLLKKGLDAIVANDVTEPGAGFAADTNRVTVLTRDGREQPLQGSKREVARAVLDLLCAKLPSPSGRGTG
ncbi:bifunctional phosphopantothenoylcysteine decarboxylase/phosphopantothenate--cysteine ligase CoaBC [Aggregicoccus sp. 17bor-14]|uniref:bifunctional phosphopantothenoylcysteine decarboxylase/phosphopantothenate--cysteine ligase CoaBC n=1 Tax=Myxococcaceae TaxID=31 RepID=UPI00129D1704|nr:MULTISPECIES: bifunctional phosphopantothenoylcysteine decarboxylase/phosphopantothenate--cysteine ligase CoaBC [Myxococcaceae]MBF5044195.1 bifunctional phosphopantothenoylcysteine decarboxylase/phosphopantothenate--cysteine ligase CoaBC [Simulacricoccus sp. 17bor-14]MRI89945.1 bifunctional phosphopantothenoylcysteine decarboxylase/phosphopantothenate--cysteine ligase CoaBC [Aggregicoccus sp. 17bor-14]